MKQFNVDFIYKSIDLISKSCQTNQNTKLIIDFWNDFAGEKLSYIGFNFENGTISSVKLYFTVFTSTISDSDFPLKPLLAEFKNNLNKQSNFLTQKYSNGGGITFSIKVKFNSSLIEHGYYMRCNELNTDENKLVGLQKLPFKLDIYNEPLGVYKTFEGLQSKTSIYGYINPKSHLLSNDLSDVIYSEKIRGIEVAKIENLEKLKLIYLGGEDLLKTTLIQYIPEEVVTFKNKFKLNFVCPAFNNNHVLCSIYLTDFTNNSKLPDINKLTY